MGLGRVVSHSRPGTQTNQLDDPADLSLIPSGLLVASFIQWLKWGRADSHPRPGTRTNQLDAPADL
jgi:hypothetical protein